MNGDPIPGQVSTIFLVHGTRARGAPWSRPGSPLANAIATAYPQVRIISFDWSGDNSHAARVAAGRHLASRIRRVAAEMPGSRIVIIGHSHGGNVALYALRDRSVAALISDVIFLGTPFFRFGRIDVRPAVRLFARVVGFLVFLAAMSIAIWAAYQFGPGIVSAMTPWLPNTETMWFIVFGTSLIAWSLAMIFWYLPLFVGSAVERLFGITISSFLLRRRAALFRRLATPPLPVRGLVVRSVLDEAFLYLTGLALVTSSPFFIWSVIVTCTRSIPLIVAFLLLSRCAGDSFVPEMDAFVSMNSVYIAAIGIACLYPAALVATLPMIAVPAVTRGNRFAFGWVGFLGAALVDVQPMPVPVVADGVPVSLLVSRLGRRRLMSLIHSSYYSDPSLIRQYVSFLSGSSIGETIRPDGRSLRRWEPVLRRVVAATAVVISSAAMLRYDYIEQQKVIWEQDTASPPELGSRVIFKADRIKSRLGPGEALTVKLDFGAMVSGEICRLIGHYRSDGSKITVGVRIVKLSEHDGKARYYNTVMDWYGQGGDRIVPSKQKQPPPGEERKRLIQWALVEQAHEAGFRQSWENISTHYWGRKEVHFNRFIRDAEPGGVGGVLVRNRGVTNPINVDLSVAVICRKAA